MDDLIPIACSLDHGETRQRSAEWSRLAPFVIGVERTDRHLDIRFTATVRDELDRLVEAEKECCGFAAWNLTEAGDEMVLTISGDEFDVAALAETISAWGLTR